MIQSHLEISVSRVPRRRRVSRRCQAEASAEALGVQNHRNGPEQNVIASAIVEIGCLGAGMPGHALRNFDPPVVLVGFSRSSSPLAEAMAATDWLELPAGQGTAPE